ncbi:MAG: hypothetical protein A3I66_15250 [Burkholderiales bacterium RIFCSPLOWO2_02_FULL_57_36]|nr:MAG: hypothetical protein A3I66_15250 [Burkholderiales bacterium RIFCSPLOWO2_02_FULL_57_36]
MGERYFTAPHQPEKPFLRDPSQTDVFYKIGQGTNEQAKTGNFLPLPALPTSTQNRRGRLPYLN